MKILVADDDLGSRLVTQAAVEALGHECVVAADGLAAWQAFLDYGPEVVVTDRVMPGLDGVALCRAIRACTNDAYTYIVLLTSLSDRGDVLVGMQAGADDYITKPLDPFDLEVRLLAASRVTALHAQLGRYRAELAEQVRTDPLTGLRNRVRLAEELEFLHGESQRHRRGYCLALCDVDFFKRYNDRYGHQAGDEALRAVAASLSRRARGGDGVYRYGGEEFLVVLPDQDLTGALVAMERMRRGVEALGIAHAGGGPAGVLTMSVGISSFLPGRRVSSQRLLKEADLALYEAKEAGRNRVVFAPPRSVEAALTAG